MFLPLSFILLHSPTRFGQTWIPQNHVFLEQVLFCLPNSSLCLLKMYSSIEPIQRFNKDSLNCSLGFTYKKPGSIRNKTNLERLVCVTLKSQSSYNKAQP